MIELRITLFDISSSNQLPLSSISSSPPTKPIHSRDTDRNNKTEDTEDPCHDDGDQALDDSGGVADAGGEEPLGGLVGAEGGADVAEDAANGGAAAGEKERRRRGGRERERVRMKGAMGEEGSRGGDDKAVVMRRRELLLRGGWSEGASDKAERRRQGEAEGEGKGKGEGGRTRSPWKGSRRGNFRKRLRPMQKTWWVG